MPLLLQLAKSKKCLRHFHAFLALRYSSIHFRQRVLVVSLQAGKKRKDYEVE
jgi:hypothetical protein